MHLPHPTLVTPIGAAETATSLGERKAVAGEDASAILSEHIVDELLGEGGMLGVADRRDRVAGDDV